MKRQPESERRSLDEGCQVSGVDVRTAFLCTWWDVVEACPFFPLKPPATALGKGGEKKKSMLNKRICWIIEAAISIQALWSQSAQWQQDHWMASHLHHCKICRAFQPGWAKPSEACNSIAMLIYQHPFRTAKKKKDHLWIPKGSCKWTLIPKWFTHVAIHLAGEASYLTEKAIGCVNIMQRIYKIYMYLQAHFGSSSK